jgi:hypothetical protein
VVARPALLSPQRRALVARVAQAHPLAWGERPSVRVFAGIERRDANGDRRATWLLRADDAVSSLRASLEAQRLLTVRWEAEARCRGVHCAARASLGADGVVRITSGPPDTRGDDPSRGATNPCVALARSEPEALEVSVSLGTVPGVLRESRILRVEGERLLYEERLATRGPDATARALAWLEAAENARIHTVFQDGVFRRVERIAGASEIVLRSEADFDGLALRAEDERRLAEALEAEHARSAPLALADVDFSDVELVGAQRALREARIQGLRGGARANAVDELAVLLEVAQAANPDDVETARALVLLRLHERGEGAEAALLAADMAARDPLGARTWRALEREGYALAGDARLAGALVRDGIAAAVESERVAADATASRRQGLAYAWAEGGAIVGRRFEALAATAPVERIPETPLGFVGLPAALVRLLWMGAPDPHTPFAVYVFLHAESPANPAHVSSSDPRRPMRISSLRGAESLLVAARSDEGPESLAELGAELARGLVGAGRAELAIAFVPLEAVVFAPSVFVLLRGEVRGDALVADGVSRTAATLDWARVADVLVKPLGVLAQRFPLPTIEIALRDQGEVRRGLERVVDVDCRPEGTRLRCVGPDARALADAVHAIASPLFATGPRALWRAETGQRVRGATARRARELPAGPRSQ